MFNEYDFKVVGVKHLVNLLNIPEMNKEVFFQKLLLKVQPGMSNKNYQLILETASEVIDQYIEEEKDSN